MQLQGFRMLHRGAMNTAVGLNFNGFNGIFMGCVILAVALAVCAPVNCALSDGKLGCSACGVCSCELCSL